MSKFIPLLLVSIILSACGGVPSDTSSPEPLGSPVSSPGADCSPATSWTIALDRNGGIGGFDQRLTLDSSGKLIVKSERPRADGEATLPPDEVERIGDLLVAACPFEPSRSQGVCADCFLYGLEIRMDSRSYSVQATDVTLTTELQALIEALNVYLQDLTTK